MNANKSILVCGGAGYIGAHVVRALIEAGHNPIVIDDLSTGHASTIPPAVPFIRGSIGDRPLLDQLFSQYHINAVVHLCASILVSESVQNPRKYYRNNVANGLVLLEAMLDRNVHTIVFSSTAAVYGNPQFSPLTEDHPTVPINPYGQTKLTFEHMLHDFGQAHNLRWIALRYFNAAGALPDANIGEDHHPESHLIPLVLNAALGIKHPDLADTLPIALKVFGSDYPTPDGTCLRDYIHVCDLANAHLLALDHLNADGESMPLNLGNGAGFSVKQVIQTCKAVTGLGIEYELADRRPGDSPELISDPALAKKVLGWTPEFTDLTAIVKTAWDFHQRFPKGLPPTDSDLL